MTTRISCDLDALTWGELIAFVDTARSAGVGDDESVAQVSDLLDDSTVTAFEFTFPRAFPHGGPSISPTSADEVRALLAALAEADSLPEGIRERVTVVRALVG